MSSCKGSSMNNMLKTQGGGIRKKNGHKANCKCPICVNMKHAKGGAGYDFEDSDDTPSIQEGGKKSNGHKANCTCPICKNMKKSSAKNMKGGNTKTMTMKGGKKSNGHKANCKCPICKNMKKRGGDDEESSSDKMSDDMGESSSSSNMGESSSDNMSDDMGESSSSSNMGESSSDMNNDNTNKQSMLGGKKSNGHKANCKCPICKNMKRGKKTQRKTKGGKKKSHRRR